MKPEDHPKGWGKELWIANKAYCGKKMQLDKGKKCSVHYHKNKEETFYIQSGKMELRLWKNGFPGPETKIVLGPGEIIHLIPGDIHQFFGLEDCTFFEFSTHHEEEDSYRLAPGDGQNAATFVPSEPPSTQKDV